MQNNWDSIQQLAQQAGASPFVFNGNLYFNALGQSAGGGPYQIHYIPPTAESYDAANAIAIKDHSTSRWGRAHKLLPSRSRRTLKIWLRRPRQVKVRPAPVAQRPISRIQAVRHRHRRRLHLSQMG